MKRNLLFLLGWLCLNYEVCAQGIVFQKGSWEDVLALAEQENKAVFVDFYTSWCGPCKMMEKEVFSQEKVGEYYNRNFVCCQIDGEKGEGPALVKKYKITGYPTFLYLDCRGQVLYRFSGARKVNEFLMEAERVSLCARFGGWEKMQADYKAGSENPELLKVYSELCSPQEKAKVLNRYLRSLPDEQLFAQETGKLFEQGLTVYHYPLMKRLIEGRVKMGEQNAEFDFVFTFPLQFKMTEFFNRSVREGNKELLEELLSLKRTFSVLPLSLDGDIHIMEGRGLYFASEDWINLSYLYENRNDDEQFKALLESYLPVLIQENPLDTLEARTHFLEQLIEYLSDANQRLAESYMLFGRTMVDFIDYYWRIVPSDKKHREQCIAWLGYVSRMNPYNSEVAMMSAELFVRLHDKKAALECLEMAVEKQKNFTQDKPVKILKRLEDLLRDIRNDKV